jgi:ABC-2 type transport system permease protein
MPAILIGMQMVTNREAYRGLGEYPLHAAAMVFGVACIVLSTGACNTLAVEAPVLWIYFTVPRPLERILVDKALFWAAIASVVSVVTVAGIAAASGTSVAVSASSLLLVTVGIVMYAFIATAIGVLGTDPLETEPRRRISIAMVYLFMLLAMMFAYALYAPSWWAKFAQLVLSALLVFALWQKVRDHTPFLLDPTEAPPPTIAVADGVIAVLAFFVLQGLLVVLCVTADISPGASLLFGFSGAGVVVATMSLYVFWRKHVPNLLATLGLRLREGNVVRALLLGIAGGAAAAVLAQAYLFVVDHVDVLRRVRDETVAISPKDLTPGAVPWMIALAVVAAPVFEEFIFRAIMYGGFRRSIGPLRAAVASALIFAIVHPAIASTPVFFLGLIAAIVYERSRLLLAAIAAHMTYNGLIIVGELLRS